jgi:hypothetical protein
MILRTRVRYPVNACSVGSTGRMTGYRRGRYRATTASRADPEPHRSTRTAMAYPSPVQSFVPLTCPPPRHTESPGVVPTSLLAVSLACPNTLAPASQQTTHRAVPPQVSALAEPAPSLGKLMFCH